MGKETVNEVQQAQRVPHRINPRRSMPRHILIKLTNTKHKERILNKLTNTKHKERILNAAREKQHVTCKGNPICLAADLTAETLQARREWQDIFKVLKGKKIYNQDYSIRQRPHSKLMEKEKAFQTSKS